MVIMFIAWAYIYYLYLLYIQFTLLPEVYLCQFLYPKMSDYSFGFLFQKMVLERARQIMSWPHFFMNIVVKSYPLLTEPLGYRNPQIQTSGRSEQYAVFCISAHIYVDSATLKRQMTQKNGREVAAATSIINF